jgi:hypothetical protein
MAAENVAPEIPDWIFPGAKVILLVDDYGSRDNPRIYDATVAKLAKLSFTVTFSDDREERINFKNLRSKDQGSGYRNWRYRVIEPTSAEVRRLRELQDRKNSRDKAWRAAKQFTDNNVDRDDLTLIREAIVALIKHGDLVHEQDTANPVHRADSTGGMTRCGKPAADYPFYVRFADQGVTCPDCKEN